MTGLYVHNQGHRSLWQLLQPTEPSLFRYLKNSGYDIKWFGKNDLYSQAYLDEICDDIDEKRKGYKSPPKTPHGKSRNYANAYRFEDDEYYSFLYEPVPDEGERAPIDQEIARGIDFLKNWKEGDKPFILFLPILSPHPPFSAPRRFHDMYDPAELKDLLIKHEDLKGKPAYYELIRNYRRLHKLTPDFLAKIHAVYLGMNSYVDYLLGVLMDVMEEKGLFENTTLIASSDHGEYAGNYGLVEKWHNAMEDLLVRVPLLIKAPGKAKGHVVREQNELFDVMPTIMELAGLKVDHAHFARSLVPQLEGKAGDPARYAFAEGGFDAQDERCFEYHVRAGRLLDEKNIYFPKVIQQVHHPASVARTTMIRSLTHKLVMRTSGENELYDLRKDSRETVNEYANPAYAAIRGELETAMLNWYISTADAVSRVDDPRGFDPAAPF